MPHCKFSAIYRPKFFDQINWPIGELVIADYGLKDIIILDTHNPSVKIVSSKEHQENYHESVQITLTSAILKPAYMNKLSNQNLPII